VTRPHPDVEAVQDALLPQAHPGYPGWSQDESDQADVEGWNVFHCDGSMHGEWQLFKDDEGDILDSDEDVVKLVNFCALNGSRLHQRAIDFIRRYNEPEFNTYQLRIETDVYRPTEQPASQAQ
jgi:hypothetical protein